ncbi:MAG TPA: ATP-binding protein [Nitrospirales bacterium]|jgi:signal transduction histidine kinase
MNAFALSGLLTAASSLAMGLFVLAQDKRAKLNRLWLLFTASVAVWGIGATWIALEKDPHQALLAWRFSFAFGVVWIPVFFYHFVTIFCALTQRKLVVINYIIATLLFPLIGFSSLFFGNVRFLFAAFYYAVPGSALFVLFFCWWAWLVIYAHYQVFRLYRHASGIKRNQFKYFFIAFALAYGTGSLDYLPIFKIDLYPYGNFGIMAYPIITTYAIARYRLMDITVVFQKGLTYALLLGALLVPVFLTVAVSHRATAYAIPPLVAASFVFGCGLWIVLKNPRNDVNLTFGLLCAGVCIWLFSIFMMFSSPQEGEAVLWGKMAYVGVVFIPALFYHFCMRFLKRSDEKISVVVQYIISTGFLALIPTDYLISGRYVHDWGVYLKAGALYPLFLGYFGTVSGLSLLALYRGFKAKTADAPAEATRIKYVLVAFAIGYLASIDFAQAYGAEFYPIGFVFVGLWISIVMYAIVAYEFLESPWLPRTDVLPYAQALALTPAYFVILGVVWIFTGTTYYLLAGVLLTILIVLAELLVNVRKGMEQVVGKALFPHQHNTYDALNAFSTAMRSILELKALTAKTVSILSEALGIGKISIFLLDKEKDEYILAAVHGINKPRLKAVTISAKELLPQYLQERSQAILKEELERRGDTPGVFSKRIIGTLDDLEAELCLPLQNQGLLIGFINLGPKPNRGMYTHEDLKNLSILAASAASAFENAAFHQLEKDVQRREKHDERAHAFETIAGGFAHEIRNPLVSINTFLELVPMRKDDPEFMEEFRKVVMNDSARIERLSGEVLGFARLHEPQRQEENLNDLVAASQLAIEARAQSQGVALCTELAENLPHVWMDSQQMRQVLGNLYINSLDAMEPAGVGQIITKTCPLMKPDGIWVQIEITDTGCGMPPETLDNIFVPFFTTKHESKEREGTGLGLPICQRIIVAHGGYIEVKSEIGKGTTFLVNLPVRLERNPDSLPNPEGTRREDH